MRYGRHAAKTVSQMEMHLVELQKSHGIHLLHQELLGAEMSGHIEMQSPVAEFRAVRHLAAHNLRAHLTKGLKCIESTGKRRGIDQHPVRPYLKRI